MSDEETTDSNAAAPPASEPATSGATDDGDRHTVRIPQWLAGALVVVLALLIGAVGYAIGASSNDADRPAFRPINASQQPGGPQSGPARGFPGGPGGQEAGPGGQRGGPGGQPGGPRGGPGVDDRGDRQGPRDQDQPDDSSDDQPEDART